MKNLIIALGVSILTNISAYAQTIDTNYFPVYTANVLKEDYDYGKSILTNAYAQINDAQNLTYVDYWNIAVGYVRMGVDKQIVYNFLKKSKEIDSTNFCMIVKYANGARNNGVMGHFKKRLGEDYLNLIANCSNDEIEAQSITDRLKIKEEIEINEYNEELIDKLIYLLDKDQRYRYDPKVYKDNREKQEALDKEVREALATIFDRYGYPGKELVSEEFSDYGCLLLEHSGDVATYDKYFPLVAEAYMDGEIKRAYFTMFIDRIHWRKTGKQIFGSHAGIPFADIETIAEI